MLNVEPHPLLDLVAFTTDWPAPLGEVHTSPEVARALTAPAPEPTEEVRLAIRDLLRHGGFKPTGRSKPASEYLVKAVAEGRLGPINPAVDALNAASRVTGVPVSIVDLDLVSAPLRVGLTPEGASYVFNAGGQTIDLGGLLCLFDAQGPCANAVKDAQRTKTHEGTRRTLTVVWGSTQVPGLARRTAALIEDLYSTMNAVSSAVPPA